MKPRPSIPTASVVHVDFRRADDLLLANEGNRIIRPAWVRELRRIIRENMWVLTNDAITITADGLVTNGQHRLFAISDERVPAPGLPVMVLEGVDREDRIAYDQGKPRNESDLLRLRGKSGGSSHVALARMMVTGERTFPSRIEAVNWTVVQWAHIAFAWKFLERYTSDPTLRGLACSGVGGALARAHATLPVARVDELIRFAERLLRGPKMRASNDRDAGVDTLRDRILRDWNAPGMRATQRDIFWSVQSVLAAWLDGRSFDFTKDSIKMMHLLPTPPAPKYMRRDK